MWRWGSRTWSAATITFRTRRSRCCCIGALGAPVPTFAHVPLILGPDKKRLSKRHGATSVMEYARQGYLPEAMVNFLALLGWSPGSGDRSLHARASSLRRSTLDGISGGNAVFNPEKLDWFNQQHIMRLAPDELARRVKPLLEAAGLWDDDYLAIGTPGSSRCSSCSSRARSGSTSSSAQAASFFDDASSTMMPRSRSICASTDARASRGARRGVRGTAGLRRGLD